MSARAEGSLRVIVLHPTFEIWGGAEWFAHAVAQRLVRERGASVTLLTHRFERAWGDAPSYRVVEHRGGGYLSGPADWGRVARRFGALVRAHDAVLVHNWPATEWLRFMHADSPLQRSVWYCHEPPRALFDEAARIPGQEPRAAATSFVRGLRFHGIRLPLAILRRRRAARVLADPSQVRALVEEHRRGARHFSHVAANSAFTAARVRALYGLDARVVYPIGDELIGTPRVDGMGGEKAVLWVGRMTPEKHPVETVRAWHRAGARTKGLRLEMVGDGPLRGEVTRAVAEAGDSGSVTLLRDLSREGLRARYRAAWVTLFTADSEPLGLVPLESMAEGTPVIAHDQGGPLETIAHDATGWLRPLVTEADIALAIDDAVAKRDALLAMRPACVARIRERFSPERTIDQLLEMLAGANSSS